MAKYLYPILFSAMLLLFTACSNKLHYLYGERTLVTCLADSCALLCEDKITLRESADKNNNCANLPPHANPENWPSFMSFSEQGHFFFAFGTEVFRDTVHKEDPAGEMYFETRKMMEGVYTYNKRTRTLNLYLQKNHQPKFDPYWMGRFHLHYDKANDLVVLEKLKSKTAR